MSKTYTLTAATKNTNLFGGKKSSPVSNTFSGYESHTGTLQFGCSSGDVFYCVSMYFNADTIAHLRSLPSTAITSAKIVLTHSAVAWDSTYRIGLKSSTSKTSFTVSSSKTIDVSKDAKSTTVDVKSLGFPSTASYTYGISVKKYTQPVLSKAVLTVVTAEVDYTLSYDANGGSGAPSSQTATGVGSATFKISTTEPTRTNYKFIGWSTSAEATEAEYAAGSSITISANTKLYAVWAIQSIVHVVGSDGNMHDGIVYVVGSDGNMHVGIVYVVGEDGNLHVNG